METQQAVDVTWSTLLPRLARYLPAGQFNRLRNLPEMGQPDDKQAQRRISRELLDATRSLDPLYRVLAHYMPRYQLELDPSPGRPHGEILEGTFVFADVTGFTALTELLSKQGHTQGRELMNQIMNRLFASLLDPLTASGGDLLIFAGDAVLAYFPKQNNDNDVFQATRAALRMQRAVAPFVSFDTEYGACSLTISVGVERGIAFAGFAGTAQRMELLVSGPGTFAATAAEEQGEPGEVVMGPQAREIVKDHFSVNGSVVIDDLGDDLDDYEISLPSRRAGSSAVLGLEIDEVLQALEFNLQRVERLAPFLPEDMLARLVNSTDRHRQLDAEFRPAAVQFIYIVGLEDLAVQRGAEFASTVFQRYFVQTQEIVNRHEGVISQIDTYGHGFILLNTFGAPRAHEGTSLYAVSASLQLGRMLEQLNREFELDPPLRQKGGITHGLIFTGEIGATYRRESVIAGPAVNRAARLMSKAQFGQVILDADIWAATRHAFVGEKLPSVALKGIDGEVVIINVRQMRRGSRLQPPERPLVGRETEQLQLGKALDVLEQKRGSAWMVSGETGLGKTSLAADLAARARQQETTVLVGCCQPHGKHIPLFPWLDILAGRLDADETAGSGEQRAHLAAELEALGMPASEAALADLLGLPAAETPEKSEDHPAAQETPSMFAALTQRVDDEPAPPATGGLTALLRQRLDEQDFGTPELSVWQKLEERVSGPRIIVDWLTRLAEREPLLLIIEDVHWLDAESLNLLDDLLTSIEKLPLLLVLTGRTPIDNGRVLPLPLAPLSNIAIAKIAERALGGYSLDDTLAVWIYEQAGGSPLFAETLCRALQTDDAVLVDRDTGEIRWTRMVPTLPVSLHELLLSRLEELPIVEQDVLRRAAVLGVSFTYDGLVALCRKQGEEKEVAAALDKAVHISFLNRMNDSTYRFNHSLMQETIYETLSYAQRQQWHTQIGDWLVEHRPDEPLEVVAYHYLRGTDGNKAAQFGCRAGDKARRRGVLAGALDYYEQVLALPDVPNDMKVSAAESRADVLTLQGDYSAALAAYTELDSANAAGKKALLSGDLAQLAETEFEDRLRPWMIGGQAWLLAQTGQTDAAREMVAEALCTTNDNVARFSLEALSQKLSDQQGVGEYREWLNRFAKGFLDEI